MLRITVPIPRHRDDRVHRYLPVLAVTGLMLAPQPTLAGAHVILQQPRSTLVSPAADLDRRGIRRTARRHRYAYGERFTPGQHWQPWPSGRHHRYWHGGVTSAFCYGIISIPDRRCYERHW